MYPVFKNSNQEGHDPQSFEENLIEICNNHRNEVSALAFAFILYDFTNPQINKILRDDDYWTALHLISGDLLSVFSIHKGPERPSWDVDKERSKKGMESMTAIPSNKQPDVTTDQIISRYFNADIKVSYPALLFFQVDGRKVIDAILVGLNAERLEDSFLEIKTYILSAVKALKTISSDSKGNHSEIFNQLEGNVRQTRTFKIIREIGSKGFDILSIVSSVAGIV
ncbi:hypothetical protein [Pedobacter psychrodurus]|uniref:hypothetical protein n=1 Tax=Pedobacter psychrodurus TaxID=2530456 RepID=UPI00292DEB0F|nr:hypothetical protein [Pedobacter psychrodurus]